MCECGCSMGGPDFKFPGPRGVWYGVRLYSGCRECDAPVGVDIFRISGSEDYDAMGLKYVPLLTFHEEAGTASLPILRAKELIHELGEIGIEIDQDAYSDGDVIDAVRHAVGHTESAWRKAVEQHKPF